MTREPLPRLTTWFRLRTLWASSSLTLLNLPQRYGGVTGVSSALAQLVEIDRGKLGVWQIVCSRTIASFCANAADFAH